MPGLTQYPIPVGGNFLYNFTLFQSGFHWYHSHYVSRRNLDAQLENLPQASQKMQLDDGLKGTLYIRPKAGKAKPFNQTEGKALRGRRFEVEVKRHTFQFHQLACERLRP